MKIVLASASPRREDLLAGLGVSFEVRPSRLAEEIGRVRPEEAADLAARLARRKAEDAAGRLRAEGSLAPGTVIVAADTLVVLPDRVLGKPASEDEARGMLRLLSGREHRVVTAVAVLDPTTGRWAEGAEETGVWFRPLDEATIRAYAATGEPADKAGAYAVQGVGSLLVERIDGDYFNVVGLPLGLLAGLLRGLGFDLMAEAATSVKAGKKAVEAPDESSGDQAQ